MNANLFSKKGFLVFLSFFSVCSISAQYRIEELQKYTQQNYPLIVKYSLLDKSKDFTISNINRRNLPQVALGAQASYQSNVTAFPEQMKEIYSNMGLDLKGLNKDQYKLGVTINQNIWDGGNISASKEIVKAENEVNKRENDLQIYEVNKRVNELFFSVLLLDASEKQNKIYRDLLMANLDKVNSLVRNGVAIATDAQMIEVEILKSEQQLVSIEANKQAFLSMLSLLSGKEINSSSQLVEPSAENYIISKEIKSPEIALFDSKIKLLNMKKREVSASSMPELTAFVQGMYGNPGLNMFDNMINNKWNWDYMAGIKFQWSIGSFYYKKNRNRSIDTNIEIVNNQKETFLFNTNMLVAQQESMILKAKKILSQDEKIIELMESIRKSSESKLKNGTIGVTDLLDDISKENTARVDRILHNTEFLKSIYDLKYTTNN